MTRWMSGFAAAALLAAAPAANAGLLSGFEPGLDGWQTLGDVSIQDASIGLDPSQGSRMAFITTMCDRTALPVQGGGCNTTTNEHPYSGVSSPYAGYAREFLGLPYDYKEFAQIIPSLDLAIGESGAMSFHFYAEEAGAISFDWNRIGMDSDAAYFSLWADDGSSRTTELIFGGIAPASSFQPSGVDLCSRYYDTTSPDPRCSGFLGSVLNAETGWSTRTVSVASAGWYTIGFAMAEVAEGTTPTVLALDNLRFIAAPVPEPESLAMLAAGLLGAIGIVRRRRTA